MPAKIEQVCQSRDGECFDQCLGKHVSLMEGEWSCYGGGQVEEEWSCCRGGHFNKGRMVMLQRWPV